MYINPISEINKQNNLETKAGGLREKKMVDMLFYFNSVK